MILYCVADTIFKMIYALRTFCKTLFNLMVNLYKWIKIHIIAHSDIFFFYQLRIFFITNYDRCVGDMPMMLAKYIYWILHYSMKPYFGTYISQWKKKRL